MTASLIYDNTISRLPFPPNEEQILLIKALSLFVTERIANDVFVLNGYAGTGKTSVIGAFVKTISELKKKTVVLAPTGRAAKVAAKFSEGKASTIHKRLFRGNSLDPNNFSFFLAENNSRDTIFIVDEASLITDGEVFSSSLLMQLIKYVYSGQRCNMILIGDLAQLPPVGQPFSHAMNSERLMHLGLNPISYTLSTPARQAEDSGILFNATFVRQALFSSLPLNKFSIFSSGFPDVKIVEPTEMLDEISSSWGRVGKDETIIITRSNFRANNINGTVRKYLLDTDSPLVKGEKLIISKNDYYWSEKNKLKNFIANGETVEILKVGSKIKAYGRWFADTEILIPDSGEILNVKIMLRSLVSENSSIPREEMERFYNRVLSHYPGELSQQIKKALEDPYYNALQVKYGYCITCHKAQGGQWKNVFIDMGGIAKDVTENDFYRWLYTAVTRATECIYFVNPSFTIE